MRRLLLLGSCLLVSLSVFSACASTPAPPVLEGTHWLLESYEQSGTTKSPLKDAPVTMVFNKETGVVNGSTGCNSYFGGYEADNGKLTMTGSIGSTKKACAPAVMLQETNFLLMLRTSGAYRIEGEKLTLTSGGGTLVFKRVD
jgi:heat shock protein HslJ